MTATDHEHEQHLLTAEICRRVAHKGIGQCFWDLVSNEMVWSPGLYHLFGLTPEHEDVSYVRFLRSFYPADRDYAENLIFLALDLGHRQVGHQRIVHRSNGVRRVCLLAEPSLDRGGHRNRLFLTLMDLAGTQ